MTLPKLPLIGLGLRFRRGLSGRAFLRQLSLNRELAVTVFLAPCSRVSDTQKIVGRGIPRLHFDGTLKR